MNKSALISVDTLKDILNEPHVRILDASYNQPPLPVKIPHAQEFDIDAIADISAPLAHTLPTADDFAKAVGDMGIKETHTVIIYDRSGIYMAAARAWWMFRTFGHKNVYVLNGGLPAWVGQDYDLEPTDIASDFAPETYTPQFNRDLLKTKEDVLQNLEDNTFTLIDARDALRFSGMIEENRPGVDTGHIPHAINLPFDTFIQHDSGELKTPEQIKTILDAIQLDITQKPLAVSCGSGVTACVVAMGLYELGIKNVAIYDGSWTEWGSSPDLPKAKGRKS